MGGWFWKVQSRLAGRELVYGLIRAWSSILLVLVLEVEGCSRGGLLIECYE
jgi:hypothetical protein